MQVLPGLEARGLDIELLNVPGKPRYQPAVPGSMRNSSSRSLYLSAPQLTGRPTSSAAMHSSGSQRGRKRVKSRGHRVVYRHRHEVRVLTDVCRQQE
jgi:hypothetical protein